MCFLEYLRRFENIPGPFLIIGSLTTIGHWHRQITNWTNMNVVVYQGDLDSRKMIREFELYAAGREYRFHVLLTTYEIFMREDWTDLLKIRWRCLAVDEAHRLNNTGSKLQEQFRLCISEHRVLLTGTPVQSILEVWRLLNVIEPIKFSSQARFIEECGELTTEDQIKRLHETLLPFILRRLKHDVERRLEPN